MFRLTRRSFVVLAGALVASLGLQMGAMAQTIPPGMTPEEYAVRLKRGLQDYTGTPKSEHPLKILFLGGTGFLGPHTVQYALARGHEVTLFNRGNRNEAIFPQLEEIIGDRDPNKNEGLKGIEKAIADGRKWDVVIDTSGYVPRIVGASAELLNDAASQYIFISSISAYADASEGNITEESAVAVIPDPTVEEITNESYGALKALCEQAAEKAFPGRTTNIRPGFIVGPKDGSNRFAYWPVRIAKGGKVLVPPRPDPIQVIDVRDLGEFIITCAENKTMGVFNAVGPGRVLTMGELLDASKKVSGSDAEFVYATAEALDANENEVENAFPIWTRPGSAFGGFGSVSYAKAVGAGMKYRPIEDTVKVTLEWWNGISDQAKAGMWDPRTGHLSPEREAMIIAAIETGSPIPPPAPAPTEAPAQ